ncbi:MAG: C-GCAxxG-C-C family protein [Spirochaetota bacterium]
MNLTERAVSYFASGCNCAQSILEAFLPAVGLDRDTASHIGAGLGGGIGGRQETCGALNGGSIVLSFARASAGYGDASSRVADLVERFKAEFGSARCIDVLGYDKNDPAAVAAAPPDAKDVCARCVRFVARRLDSELAST